jgi:mono/diheme cytochrome c family protein
MKHLIPVLLIAASGVALAETPRQIGDTYAAAQGGGFRATAARGAEFFARKFNVSEKMPTCATCHTDNPAQPGRHAITGKTIKPLAPVANAERLSDPAKVEKWFTRNCKEVVGRECSAGEKADFVAYLAEVR